MLKIHPPSSGPIFKSQELSIRGIGIREVMPPCYIHRPGGSGDYLFMIFHDPVCLGEHAEFLHDAGTMVFWKKGAPHFYGNPFKHWRHSWIHCDGRDVVDALRCLPHSRRDSIHFSNCSRVEKYLFDIHGEITGFVKPDRMIVRNILANLVREAARSQSASRTTAVPEALLAARLTIDTRYHERLTLAQLSSDAGFSIPYFCTEFRRHFGFPPITYLLQRRMLMAATLLRGTMLRIGEIGQRVGYDDPYHFSKLFKTSFGMPPSSLRSMERAGVTVLRSDKK